MPQNWGEGEGCRVFSYCGGIGTDAQAMKVNKGVGRGAGLVGACHHGAVLQDEGVKVSEHLVAELDPSRLHISATQHRILLVGR